MVRKKKSFYLLLFIGLLCLLFGGMLVKSLTSNFKYRELIKTIYAQDLPAFTLALAEVDELNQPPAGRLEAFLQERTFSTPLQAACANGNIAMVEALLARDADVNYVTKTAPFSPLMCAVSSTSENNLELVKILLENGADPNFTTQQNRSVLLMLIDTHRDIPNNIAIFDLLCRFGADQLHSTKTGTVLHSACYWGNDAMIRHLVALGCFDLNQSADQGLTCLMNYCRSPENHDASIVQLLLENGANPAQKDLNGKTAYDYAMEVGNLELAEQLKER